MENITDSKIALMNREERKKFFGQIERRKRMRPATLYLAVIYKRYTDEFYLKYPKPVLPVSDTIVPYTKAEQWLPKFFSNSAPVKRIKKKKKKLVQVHFPIKPILFNEVILRYYKKCADRLVNGQVIFTGYHLGYMYIQKQLRKEAAIDWKTVNESFKETGVRTLAYFDNAFTYRIISTHRKGKLNSPVSRFLFKVGRSQNSIFKRLWRILATDKLYHLRFKTYFYAIAILQLDLKNNLLQRFTQTQYLTKQNFLLSKIIKAYTEDTEYAGYKWRIENKTTVDRDEFKKDTQNIKFFYQRTKVEINQEIADKYAPKQLQLQA